jgi:hypothetical protein
MMSNVHLRCVDCVLMNQLKQEAKKQNISVNQFILSSLRYSLGLSNKPHRIVHHDLDKFANVWDKKETALFLKSIAEFEEIDKDLWL